MARSSAMVDHSATSMFMLRPDLSHMLERTALTPERPYRYHSWWYVIPAKEQAIEDVAKEYVALHGSKCIETGWRVHQSVVGPDHPMYLVVGVSSDPAACQAGQKRIEALLGQAGRDPSAEAMQFARRVEQNDSWIRPDLSFPPTQQQVGVRQHAARRVCGLWAGHGLSLFSRTAARFPPLTGPTPTWFLHSPHLGHTVSFRVIRIPQCGNPNSPL